MRSSFYIILDLTVVTVAGLLVSSAGFPFARMIRTAPMQGAAIAFTVFAPLLLMRICRRFPTLRFQNLIRRSLGITLLVFECANFTDKIATGSTLDTVLPMHLCDWALIAVAGSLWFRWQLGFELGYFWGLAGTVQALFTPAIDRTEVWWRLFGFFFSHAFIVVSVLHLLITERCRPWPRSLLRVFVCSEIYVAAALFVNVATGGNYGFLAHRPAQATLLDRFSDTHWLYVAQINGLALFLFPALYLPWWMHDFWKSKMSNAAKCNLLNLLGIGLLFGGGVWAFQLIAIALGFYEPVADDQYEPERVPDLCIRLAILSVVACTIGLLAVLGAKNIARRENAPIPPA